MFDHRLNVRSCGLKLSHSIVWRHEPRPRAVLGARCSGAILAPQGQKGADETEADSGVRRPAGDHDVEVAFPIGDAVAARLGNGAKGHSHSSPNIVPVRYLAGCP